MQKKENGRKSVQKGILLLSEIQMLLAMKRTSLAILRTSLGFFTIPLAIFTTLIVTSRYYDFFEVTHILVPLFIISFSLLVAAIFMFVISINRIVKIDKKIIALTKESETIKKLIEESDIKLQLPSFSDLTSFMGDLKKFTEHFAKK